MQTVKLNIIPGSVLPVVNVSQYDAHRQFQLVVYEGATAYNLTGKTVEIRGTKPDGNGFAYDAQDGVVSVSNNVVTISTTQQMTAVGGQTMAELRITSGTTILGTLNFILMVEPSALSDDTPISDTEIPAIERDFEAALAEAEADALKAEGHAQGTQDGTPVGSGSPYYQNNAKYYKEQADTDATNAGNSATSAEADALKSEGYAIGKQNGAAVTSGSPYYHNNAEYYDTHASEQAYNASQSATAAAADSLEAEGWAVGEQGGTPVGPTSPYYHNNAKYYSEQTDVTSLASMSDVDLTSPTNNQVLKYDAATQKWVNGTGGGGADALDDLTDVELTSPAEGDLLQYDATEQKWVNNATIPQKVAGLQETGCVNVCPNNATSQVVSGLTITKNADKTLTLSGIPNANVTIRLIGPTTMDTFKVPKSGKYKLVGIPSGGYISTYKFDLSYFSGGTEQLAIRDIGNGGIATLDTANNYLATLIIYSGTDLSTPITIKPMLTPDLSATYDDYQPYSLTNRELTENFLGGKGRIFTMTGTTPSTLDTIANTPIPGANASIYKYACLSLHYLHGSYPYQFPNPWVSGFVFCTDNNIRIKITNDNGAGLGKAFEATILELPL